jgi:hypothetical protein
MTGEVKRGQIAPADREHARAWLARFAGHDDVAFAVEGCAGWRYAAEELVGANASGAPPGTEVDIAGTDDPLAGDLSRAFGPGRIARPHRDGGSGRYVAGPDRRVQRVMRAGRRPA